MDFCSGLHPRTSHRQQVSNGLPSVAHFSPSLWSSLKKNKLRYGYELVGFSLFTLSFYFIFFNWGRRWWPGSLRCNSAICWDDRKRLLAWSHTPRQERKWFPPCTVAFTQQNNVLLSALLSSDTLSSLACTIFLSPFPPFLSSLCKTLTFLAFFSLPPPFNYPSLGPCAVSYKVNVDGLCQEVHPAPYNVVTFCPLV